LWQNEQGLRIKTFKFETNGGEPAGIGAYTDDRFWKPPYEPLEHIRMNYWIFKANPEHYRIDERLLSPEPTIVWIVTRYLERIQPGDTVFVWRAGLQPGICAVMLVEACPYQPADQEINDGFEIPPGNGSPAASQWAKCRFVKRFRTIDKSIIKKIPGLELFSFFSAFQQATNYTLTRPEGTILLDYIETHPLEAPQYPRAGTMKKAAAVLKPVAKIKINKRPAEPAGTVAMGPAASKKDKAASPAGRSSEATSQSKTGIIPSQSKTGVIPLLKCDVCGRYVISSDTERHIREVHAGKPVEWQKTR